LKVYLIKLYYRFVYAEYAVRIPVAGSAYTFAYSSFGEFFAWFVGWNLTLEYSISSKIFYNYH